MQTFIEFLSEHLFLASVISIFLNIVISIVGIIPSAFLTTFNINFFGFKWSILIGIIGEALGAAISFVLYRKGFLKLEEKVDLPNFFQKIKLTNNTKAFLIIILLRVIPFIPSSVVTLFASVSSVSFLKFFIASSIGKVPSLLLEVYSINTLLKYINLPFLLISSIIFWLIYLLIKKVF